MAFEEFRARGAEKKLGRREDGEVEWKRMGFDWPLWVLFSSGTTGRFLVVLPTLSILFESFLLSALA